ncbi:hypothetical protein [Effusibacillus pohliae]|uniref:hypothetical protein n=1 Tax=Effusibacillus pohliae TaxID=232270 RepID=UPI0038993359
MMKYRFEYDERLGIRVPHLLAEWEELSADERHDMILEWERIKARIPDRILELEREIEERQARVGREEDWGTICDLYSEIFSLASIINDLHLWMRVNQDFEPNPGIAEEHETREK